MRGVNYSDVIALSESAEGAGGGADAVDLIAVRILTKLNCCAVR